MKIQTFNHTEERFADLQLLRYSAEGFETLSLRQKTLVYHLSQAALWGRDILWDQNGRFNLRIRRLLEQVLQHYRGDRNGQEFRDFVVYLKRVWFSNGIHHHYSTEKIQPGFSEAFLRQAIGELPDQAISQTGCTSREEILRELLPVIFNPSVMPKRVNQADGEDLLLTSACNYYGEGITQAEAEEFYARMKATGNAEEPVMYGMNSQLVRSASGGLEERTWKLDGMYGEYIAHIVQHLRDALPYAENERQREVIGLLLEFYETGDLETFDRYTIAWVKETEGRVDFTNGFTEVYGDPLGLKASWEGYVNYTDLKATGRTEKLSRNAQWFEDHSPVDPRFRKSSCQGVSARVVVAAMLGGDLYPSSAIGINLPNSNWVRATHGSKSVTIGNLTHAYSEAAKGSGFRDEFVIDRETRELLCRYDETCDDLHTDLHECLGHGSGRLLPGVDPDALKSYHSTLEEARADIFALYYMADPKLVELGVMPNADAYKAGYYQQMMNGLMTQLVRILPGDNLEEAHMRNRSLIAYWTLERAQKDAQEKGGEPALCFAERDGKQYVKINDYAKLRLYFGELLGELQRIKSEGDYEAGRQLVEKYGVKVDQKLHKEVLKRYESLHIAPYKGFVNPRYELVKDAKGEVTDVKIVYGSESYVDQMLRYSRDYKGSGF